LLRHEVFVTAATLSTKSPIVLTIAGSDTSGGAGIQADLKTISACGAYGMTAITAITVQKPSGVSAVWPVTSEQLGEQIEAALTYQPAAIKIGMLGNAGLANVVADILAGHPDIPLVLDTIIRSTSGAVLLDSPGVQALRERLLPRATIITPNHQEARELFGNADEAALWAWAKNTGAALLLTGGDSALTLAGDLRFCTDIFISSDIEHLTSPRVETQNHHGTGCTLSAAIATFIAHGFSLPESVQYARQYVQQALRAAANQSWQGNGPLNHFFAFGKPVKPETAA
jgi:hydroxymethylpyrimidine/phosphomethylpyrimidine kinase